MLAPRWHEVARPERRMRAHGRTRTKRRKRNIRWPRQWQNKDRRRGRSWWRGTHGGPYTDAEMHCMQYEPVIDSYAWKDKAIAELSLV